MALTFLTAKPVKYWNGSSWVGSQDFGAIKIWNGSSWQYVGVRPYADVALVTFSPAGGTQASPTLDYAAAAGAEASYTITASSSVVWNYTNTDGNGYASVASGGSSASIELVAGYTGGYNQQIFEVSASNGAETKYWTITVESEGFG